MTAMTPGTRRLLTACLFAAVIAAPLAALSPDAQAPTWPSTATTLHSQEGDVVTPAPADATGISLSAIRVSNHDASTSYQIVAGALPAGVLMETNGLLTGTFTQSAVDTNNGSAGSYSITVRATRGAAFSD